MPTDNTSEDDTKPVVVLDSLPYVDPVPPEDYEQYALALIEDEMKRQKPPSSAVVKELAPLNFRTPLFQSEYEKVSQGKPLEPLVLPSSPPPVDVSDCNDKDSLMEAVQQARIEYEKERIRAVTLQIEKETGVSQWKQWNDQVLNPLLQQNQAVLERQKLSVEQINARRQEQQQGIGKRLQVLETQYHDLVQKQFQLRQAIAGLEQELQG